MQTLTMNKTILRCMIMLRPITRKDGKMVLNGTGTLRNPRRDGDKGHMVGTNDKTLVMESNSVDVLWGPPKALKVNWEYEGLEKRPGETTGSKKEKEMKD